MRTTLLAFILIVTACSAAQHRTEYRAVNVPGALESTLSSNPQSVLRRKLGSLTPPGTVTLFAVVAVDRSSKRWVKGLEARVEGDDIWNNNRHCKDTAYIDEETLRPFEQRLAGLVGSEKLQPHSEVPSVVMAGNRSSAEPQEGVFYVPLEVGSYWTGDRYGVYINAPESRVATGWRGGCQFNMPNADVSELLALVHKGDGWLEENLPKAQLSEGGGCPRLWRRKHCWIGRYVNSILR
jgi:hypothetical protein